MVKATKSTGPCPFCSPFADQIHWFVQQNPRTSRLHRHRRTQPGTKDDGLGSSRSKCEEWSVQRGTWRMGSQWMQVLSTQMPKTAIFKGFTLSQTILLGIQPLVFPKCFLNNCPYGKIIQEMAGSTKISNYFLLWCCPGFLHLFSWLVVSNIFYFHPYLGKWSNLTNIFFKRGWNHQVVKVVSGWQTPGEKPAGAPASFPDKELFDAGGSLGGVFPICTMEKTDTKRKGKHKVYLEKPYPKGQTSAAITGRLG